MDERDPITPAPAESAGGAYESGAQAAPPPLPEPAAASAPESPPHASTPDAAPAGAAAPGADDAADADGEAALPSLVDRAPEAPAEPAPSSRDEAAPESGAAPPQPERPNDEPASGQAAHLLAAIERLENVVEEGLSRLRDDFRAKLAFDEGKEKQIDRLHAEVQEHKKDLLGRALHPLLLGLVRLHDDFGKTVRALRERPFEELTPERFFTALGGLRDDVEILLERHGVTRFEQPEDEFDPLRQTVVRTAPAAEDHLAGRVFERVRPGFELGGAVLRKEGVAVWAAPAGPAPSPPPSPDAAAAPAAESVPAEGDPS